MDEVAVIHNTNIQAFFVMHYRLVNQSIIEVTIKHKIFRLPQDRVGVHLCDIGIVTLNITALTNDL